MLHRIEYSMFHFIVWFSRLDESSFQSIFEQITKLILVNHDQDLSTDLFRNYTTNVYARILKVFKNLKSLTVTQPFGIFYPGLSLCGLPSDTCFSPILTYLSINVNTFDDCLYLLDGRLKQLTELSVNVCDVDKPSVIPHNMVSFSK